MNPPVTKRVTVRHDDREFFEGIRLACWRALASFEWVLLAVARLEGRLEKSFVPETG